MTWMRLHEKHLCIVCGEPCQPYERNNDGTYAHSHCLKDHTVKPVQKTQ